MDLLWNQMRKLKFKLKENDGLDPDKLTIFDGYYLVNLFYATVEK